MALPFANYIVFDFGATYFDGSTGDPPFLFWIFKGDLTIKACARFDEFLIAGHFLNGLSI